MNIRALRLSSKPFYTFWVKSLKRHKPIMVYFTEKLIHEIRKRSCIWDTADVCHLNKEVLQNKWMEIAENLYSDWHSLSVFDQRDRVADVKKKWTNIKDSFVKDVKGKKPRKSHGPPEHRKKYYLFDHLQFLIPFIQESKSGDAGEPKKRTRKSGPIEGTSGPSSSHHSTRAQHMSMAAAAASGKPDIPPDVQQHADLLNNFAGKRAADALCQLDGDMSFMVSLLPTIKSMNEKQKINFKIGVLQLLARIKFDEVLHHPAVADVAAAAASYQPFVGPDFRCFPVPYQPAMPFPFIGHQAAAVSSTQQQKAAHPATAAHPTMMKHEFPDSSPPTSSLLETDPDDDDDEEADDNSYSQ